MKTTKSKIIKHRVFHNGINLISKSIISLMLLISCTIATPVAAQISVGVNITVPVWAPSYDNVDQVQYYYLPDIEVYYDVWNHHFAYLEDGNWMFSDHLPSMYASFDLSNAYVVVLNAKVHEPWMHFHYYVAHYPRYYYRSVYAGRYNDASRPIRGFNENVKTVVYRGEVHQSDQRRETVQKSEPRKETIQRAPQPMKYYGKTVGSPVKVEKQMMRPKTNADHHDNHGKK